MLELFNQAVQCCSHLLYILKVTLVLHVSLYFQIIIIVLLRLIMQGKFLTNIRYLIKSTYLLDVNVIKFCKQNLITKAKSLE